MGAAATGNGWIAGAHHCAGDVLHLQAILGHETMDTVRIYVRLAQIDLSNAQHNASPADAWRL